MRAAWGRREAPALAAWRPGSRAGRASRPAPGAGLGRLCSRWGCASSPRPTTKAPTTRAARREAERCGAVRSEGLSKLNYLDEDSLAMKTRGGAPRYGPGRESGRNEPATGKVAAGRGQARPGGAGTACVCMAEPAVFAEGSGCRPRKRAHPGEQMEASGPGLEACWKNGKIAGTRCLDDGLHHGGVDAIPLPSPAVSSESTCWCQRTRRG